MYIAHNLDVYNIPLIINAKQCLLLHTFPLLGFKSSSVLGPSTASTYMEIASYVFITALSIKQRRKCIATCFSMISLTNSPLPILASFSLLPSVSQQQQEMCSYAPAAPPYSDM